MVTCASSIAYTVMPIIIETMDFAEQKVIEIFREELVPWLGGFALPETDSK